VRFCLCLRVCVCVCVCGARARSRVLAESRTDRASGKENFYSERTRTYAKSRERKKPALCVYSTLRREVSQFLEKIVLKESQKEQERTRKKVALCSSCCGIPRRGVSRFLGKIFLKESQRERETYYVVLIGVHMETGAKNVDWWRGIRVGRL